MRNVALALAAACAFCLVFGQDLRLFQGAPVPRMPVQYTYQYTAATPYAQNAAAYAMAMPSYSYASVDSASQQSYNAGWMLLAGAALGAFGAKVASLAVAAETQKGKGEGFDQEKFIEESKEMRLKHLEEQALYALKISCENFDHAVFPNAMIAGDVVITHLLSRLGYLKDGKCKVMVVDTFHLFPETMTFLKEMEDFYGFKAEVFNAEGIPVGDKAAYDKRYGADLWKEDIEQYDKVCKVEPFQRGLKTLETNCMINGRTRWQGFERAWIDQFENAPIGGGLAKCNPLAYWTLEETFDYIKKYEIPHHPLHAQGYPSIGDARTPSRFRRTAARPSRTSSS